MRLKSSVSTAEGLFGQEDLAQTDNRLGAILVRSGRLSPADVEHVLGRQRGQGGLFGEIAVGMGLLTPNELTDGLRLQTGSQLLPMGDDRIDPMIVTAFDLDGPYAQRVRAIRADIVRHAGDDEARHGHAGCALIGFDCDRELAVLAANLAALFVRMGTPTLLIDGARDGSAMHALFRMAPPGEEDRAATVRPTAIPQLLLAASPAGVQGAPERQPLVRVADSLRDPVSQVIAAVPFDAQANAAVTAERLTGMTMAVLVVRRHVTQINRARGLIDALDDRKVRLIGSVLV